MRSRSPCLGDKMEDGCRLNIHIFITCRFPRPTPPPANQFEADLQGCSTLPKVKYLDGFCMELLESFLLIVWYKYSC